MKLNSTLATDDRERAAQPLVDLSFTEVGPLHLSNSSYSATGTHTIEDYLGNSIEVPTEVLSYVGGNFVCNQFDLSETDSDGWTAGGTTPPALGDATLRNMDAATITFTATSDAGYAGSHAHTDAIFTISELRYYAARMRVKLSRALIDDESVSFVITNYEALSTFVIDATNSEQFTGEIGDYVTSYGIASTSGTEFWAVYLSNAVQSDLVVTATEIQAIDTQQELTNLGQLPYVSVGVLSAPYQGYGADGCLWWHKDVWGYPLPTESTWIENQIQYSADWSQAATAGVSVADVDAAGFYEVARTSTGTGVISKTVNPAGPPTQVEVLLELRAGTTTELDLGLYDSAGWGAELMCQATIRSGPGEVSRYVDGSLVRVGGLSSTETTVVLLNRFDLEVATDSIEFRVYPDGSTSTRIDTSVLLGRVRAVHGTMVAPEVFQPDTGAYYETGSYLRNDLPNSTAQQDAAGELPNAWQKEDGSGVTVTCVGTGTLIDGFTRYADFQIAGTSLASVTCSIYPCWQTVNASKDEVWSTTVALQLLGSADQLSMVLSLQERDSDALLLASDSTTVVLDSTLTKFSHTRTLTNASTARINPRLRITFGAGVTVDYTIRVIEWTMRAGGPAPIYVATGVGPESRRQYLGYLSANDADFRLGVADGSYRIDCVDGRSRAYSNSRLIVSDNYSLPTLDSVRRLTVWELTEPVEIDLRDATTSFTGIISSYSGTDTRTVTDHDKRVWRLLEDELPRPGLRRIHQLCPNARWDHTHGTLPTDYSQPSGIGTYSIAVSSTVDAGEANAFLQRCDDNRAYFAITVPVAAYSTYTLSVLVEYLSTTIPVSRIVWIGSLPSGASVTAPGNVVEGKRAYAVLTTGASSGTVSLRVGLGALDTTTAICRFSRPLFVEGNNVGEDVWIDNIEYNANVPSVAYFSQDQSNNDIWIESVGGIESWPTVTTITDSNNDATTWDTDGVSLTLSLGSVPGSGPVQTFTESSGTTHRISKACTTDDDTFYIASFVLKQGTRSWVKIGVLDLWAFVNLETYEVGNSSGSPLVTFSALADGYTRVNLHFYSATTTATTVYVALATDGATDTYASGAGTIYFFWGQVAAARNRAPLLIDTGGSTPLQLELDEVLPAFDKDGGTLSVIYEIDDPDGERGIASVQNSDDPSQNHYAVYGSDGSGSIRAIGVSGGVTSFDLSQSRSNVAGLVGRHGLAISFRSDEFAMSQDGLAYSTDSSGSTPVSLNTLVLGGALNGNCLAGRLLKLVYHRNADLDLITSRSTFE